MNNNLQVQQEEGDEFPALLIGTGLVLASLILVPMSRAGNSSPSSC